MEESSNSGSDRDIRNIGPADDDGNSNGDSDEIRFNVHDENSGDYSNDDFDENHPHGYPSDEDGENRLTQSDAEYLEEVLENSDPDNDLENINFQQCNDEFGGYNSDLENGIYHRNSSDSEIFDRISYFSDSDSDSSVKNIDNGFQGYLLKSILGSGSYGVVWKVAKDDELEYALKITEVNKENEKEQDRELALSQDLHHQNLVKIHSFTRVSVDHTEIRKLLQGKETLRCHSLTEYLRKQISFNGTAIKMELCGENLRHWLQQDRLQIHPHLRTTKDYQLSIVNDLVKGTAYLHEKRIIHRDLKPENTMFSGGGVYQFPLKIGDYGTCRVLKEHQESELTSEIGTELYRAPEVMGNRYSFQSDIFSVGLLIWEVLQLLPQHSLRMDFDKLVNDKEEIRVNPPKLRPDVDFEALIIDMTKKRVAERVQNMEVVLSRMCVKFEDQVDVIQAAMNAILDKIC